MKIVPFLFVSLLIILGAISVSSCSKDDQRQEPIGIISINGIDHTIIKAGLMTDAGFPLPEAYTIVQFVIEDSEGQYNKSTIEIQLPTFLTEDDWYTLAPHDPSWRIILRNIIVGNGANMGVISEGHILIKQIGQIDKDNKRECRVAFEIILTDGTTALADVHAKFENSPLWIGGR